MIFKGKRRERFLLIPLGKVWRHSGLSWLGIEAGNALATSGWRPGLLLNIWEYTKHSPTTKMYWPPDVNSNNTGIRGRLEALCTGGTYWLNDPHVRIYSLILLSKSISPKLIFNFLSGGYKCSIWRTDPEGDPSDTCWGQSPYFQGSSLSHLQLGLVFPKQSNCSGGRLQLRGPQPHTVAQASEAPNTCIIFYLIVHYPVILLINS